MSAGARKAMSGQEVTLVDAFYESFEGFCEILIKARVASSHDSGYLTGTYILIIIQLSFNCQIRERV